MNSSGFWRTADREEELLEETLRDFARLVKDYEIAPSYKNLSVYLEAAFGSIRDGADRWVETAIDILDEKYDIQITKTAKMGAEFDQLSQDEQYRDKELLNRAGEIWWEVHEQYVGETDPISEDLIRRIITTKYKNRWGEDPPYSLTNRVISWLRPEFRFQ